MTIERERDLVRLTVTDDGIGFEPDSLASPGDGQGWGLISMGERAEAMRGRCIIHTQVNQGVQVIVEVPV